MVLLSFIHSIYFTRKQFNLLANKPYTVVIRKTLIIQYCHALTLLNFFLKKSLGINSALSSAGRLTKTRTRPGFDLRHRLLQKQQRVSSR